MRLHARVIIRDGRHAFLGSQSLRSLELDSRREVGIIVRDLRIVKKLRDVFESDWSTTSAVKQAESEAQEDRQEEAVTA